MILTTKIQSPRMRSSIIVRHRLLDKINRGLEGKLTLISAPAGFGKTTLISNWLGKTDYPCAWISIGSNDDDPTSFFSYLISTLQEINPQIGKFFQSPLETFSLIDGSQVVKYLINEIAEQETKIILIIDDYHFINNSQIHRAMDIFLEYLPRQIHVVILSRMDPPLSLSRLRVRRELTEIRCVDLRFTRQETLNFMNTLMKLDLCSKDIALLEERTEGWIASLQLVALSLQDRTDKSYFVKSFSGTHHYIIDYLVNEVISRQPKYIQDFLYYTSIIDRFCAPMCNFLFKDLLGEIDSREIINQIDRRNLFLIPLNENWGCFRYHHLFADVLRQNFQASQPDILPLIYSRASHWYEQREAQYSYRMGEAIKFALLAKDYHRGAQLIEKKAVILVNKGNWAQIIRWVKELPHNLLESYPVLCIAYTWALIFTFEDVNMEPYIAIIEKYKPLNRYALTIRGCYAFLKYNLKKTIKILKNALQQYQSYPIHNDFEAIEFFARDKAADVLGRAYYYNRQYNLAISIFEEALELSTQSGNSFVLLSSLWMLIDIKANLGKLHEVEKLALKGLSIILNGNFDEDTFITLIDFNSFTDYKVNPHAASMLFFSLADINYEWNNLNKFEAYIKQMTEFAQFSIHAGVVYYYSYPILIKYHLHHQKLDKALYWLQKIDQYRNRPLYDIEQEYSARLAMEMRLCIYQKFPDQLELLKDVEFWGKLKNFQLKDDFDLLQEFELKVWTQFLIIKNQTEKAIEILGKLIPKAQTEKRTNDLIHYLLLQSQVYYKQNQVDAALISLEQAIVLSEPNEYIRTYVDAGQIIFDLLTRLKHQNLSSYINKIISVFPSPSESPSSIELKEPLKPREKSILRCMAQGLSNREIADKLCISLSTVKWHSQKLYRKLGVKKRTKAVARARELNLL